MSQSLPAIVDKHQILLEKRVQAQLQSARALIPHNGERGRAVEDVIRNLLLEHLPEAYGVTTGFAMDCHGELSKQLDLIVFNKLQCPFILKGPADILPSEAVIFAIEVKTKMTKEAFLDVISKAKSIEALDRTSTVPQPFYLTGPTTDKTGKHMPLFLGVSETSQDTKDLKALVTGSGNPCNLVSLDGKILFPAFGPNKNARWLYEYDRPATMLVNFAIGIATQSQMPVIDFHKYSMMQVIK